MKSMKYLVVFTVLILVFSMLTSFLPTKSDQAIYEKPVRLHVLANSDSDRDQATKLIVRDAVLENVRALLSSSSDTASAIAVLAENLDSIRAVCRETLMSLGEECEVSVVLSRENYPTRAYDAMRLPAGEYESLRIRIGEAKGKNWWCVLYPALCTNVAKTEESLIKTGFTPEQIEILTNNESPKYKIKFKLLEIFAGAFSE